MSLRDNAPLLHAYLSYFESTDLIPFTIPGHKQRTSRIDRDLGAVVDHDTPLYGGLDEIKLTHGYLIQAEKLAAQLWGGKGSEIPTKARFSSGGSTHCNQAIALAIATPGKKIAISRTSHRSLLSAIVLTGMEPIWMSPEIDPASGIPMGIPLSEIERAISAGATAVFLTEPGYLDLIGFWFKLELRKGIYRIKVKVWVR
jgi:lysine decarboxylase